MSTFIDRVARGEIQAPPEDWLRETLDASLPFGDHPVVGLLTVFRKCVGCGRDTLTRWPALAPVRCTDCDG